MTKSGAVTESDRTAASDSVYGSDLLVRVLGKLGVQHIAMNPGATTRGIHESLVAVGNPEIVLTTHEGIAVAVAHGYQKACGRPMAVALHNIVGLQHATMGLFNAWCDRVPMLVVGGSGPSAESRRRPWIDWIHAARQGELVRDYVKWEHEPTEAGAMLRTLVRGWQLALSSPTGPVYVAVDTSLQEDAASRTDQRLVETWDLTNLTQEQPSASEAQLGRFADALVAADQPLILAWGLGRHGAINSLVELAEVLQAPVIEWTRAGTSIPSRHPLNATAWAEQLLPAADLVLALNVQNLEAMVCKSDDMTRETKPLMNPISQLLQIGDDVLPRNSWSNEHGAHVLADATLAVDAAGVLPELVERVERSLGGRARKQSQIVTHLSAVRAERMASWTMKAEKLGDGLTTANVAAIVGHAIDHAKYVLANGSAAGWVHRLWDLSAERPYLGDSGGAGKGYGLGAAVGAALALKGTGRIAVDMQGDGDLLYTPGALWTAVHHEVPLLIVVLNNGSYFQDERHQVQMTQVRGRDTGQLADGIRLEDPAPDYAALARSFGMTAFGPIGTADELTRTLSEAVATVIGGRPVLIDCLVAEERPWQVQ